MSERSDEVGQKERRERTRVDDGEREGGKEGVGREGGQRVRLQLKLSFPCARGATVMQGLARVPAR